MLTLIRILRNTPKENEHILVFGIGNPIIISAKLREDGVVLEPERVEFKDIINYTLRNLVATNLTDVQLESKARKEMNET